MYTIVLFLMFYHFCVLSTSILTVRFSFILTLLPWQVK